MSENRNYRYCVETMYEDITVPQQVFTEDELDTARDYAQHLFNERSEGETILLTEGNFDSDGNIIDSSSVTEIIETWE